MFRLKSSLSISLLLVIFAQVQDIAAWMKEFQDNVREIEPSQFGDDGVALGSFHYIDKNDKFVLKVQTFTSSGEMKKSCKRELNGELIRNSNGNALKVTNLGEETVLLSWTYQKKFPSTKARGYSLELFVVNVTDCSWHNRSIENRCTDYRSCNRDYAVVSTGENKFDVYAYNAEACGSGVCKFSINSNDLEKQALTATKFIDEQESFNVNWFFRPIDLYDLSKGYHYMSHNTRTGIRELMQLDHKGDIIKSKTLDYAHTGLAALSITYGYLSFCISISHPDPVTKPFQCKQFDSSLNEKFTIDLKLRDREYIAQTANLKSGGLFLYTESSAFCGAQGSCKYHSIEAKKVGTDGELSESAEVYKVDDGMKIDSFDTFVNEKKNTICSAIKILDESLSVGFLPRIRVECSSLE